MTTWTLANVPIQRLMLPLRFTRLGTRTWRTLVLAAAVSMTLAACATPEERARKVDTGSHVVTLTNGSVGSVELRRDQELRVRLATDVTDGREWALAEMAPGVLVQDGGRAFEREGLVSNIGQAAGVEVFRFRPLAAGTTTLKFDFRRPRDLQPAAQSVSFTVSVK